MSDKARVIVEVRDGIVQAVWAGAFIKVLVIDWDAINAGGSSRVFWGPPDGPESGMQPETAELVTNADKES